MPEPINPSNLCVGPQLSVLFALTKASVHTCCETLVLTSNQYKRQFSALFNYHTEHKHTPTAPHINDTSAISKRRGCSTPRRRGCTLRVWRQGCTLHVHHSETARVCPVETPLAILTPAKRSRCPASYAFLLRRAKPPDKTGHVFI